MKYFFLSLKHIFNSFASRTWSSILITKSKKSYRKNWARPTHDRYYDRKESSKLGCFNKPTNKWKTGVPDVFQRLLSCFIFINFSFVRVFLYLFICSISTFCACRCDPSLHLWLGPITFCGCVCDPWMFKVLSVTLECSKSCLWPLNVQSIVCDPWMFKVLSVTLKCSKYCL